MTGVPSRAARVVSENNDGLRSKTPFGTVGTAPGAWQGTSKVEQAVSLTPGRLSELANPSPLSPAALPTPKPRQQRQPIAGIPIEGEGGLGLGCQPSRSLLLISHLIIST